MANVNAERNETPCYFKDGISREEFEVLARKAGKRIQRVKKITIYGPLVECEVESQTGYTSWHFTIDFNNWGHVTGTYWIATENDDSIVPQRLGKILSGLVHDLFNEKGIYLRDLSTYVDWDKDIGTPFGINTNRKQNFFRRLFNIYDIVYLGCDSKELYGEHIFPVVAMLKSYGFKNIRSVPVKDVDRSGRNFPYQVEQVIIAGTSFFEKGHVFPDNVEIIITYHEKKEITVPYSSFRCKRKNHTMISEELKAMGVSQICEQPIKDLVIGLLTKDGSVETVLINGDEKTPLVARGSYTFDTKMVILYHTKK